MGSRAGLDSVKNRQISASAGIRTPMPFVQTAGQIVFWLSYVGVLVSLGRFLFPIFLFAAQPKAFFLDGLKKLEQRSPKCVWNSGGDI
jgi:hypothetical protein